MAARCQLLHGMQCMVGIPPLPSDTHGIAWCKEHLAMERWLPGVNFCRRLVVDCRHWRWINFCGRTCAFVHHVHWVHGQLCAPPPSSSCTCATMYTMCNYVHHHHVHHVHVHHQGPSLPLDITEKLLNQTNALWPFILWWVWAYCQWWL